MKSRYALAAVVFGLLLLPFGSLSAAMPELAAAAADDAKISPVSVVGHAQDKSLALGILASPLSGQSFSTGSIMTLASYVGYRVEDPDFDWDTVFLRRVVYAAAEPYAGAIAMEIGLADTQTIRYLGRDPADLSIWVFSYTYDWRLPPHGAVPFFVDAGETRTYEILAYERYYTPPFDFAVVDLTFNTKSSPTDPPHEYLEDPKAMPAGDQQGEAATWGEVKALYR